MSIEIGSEFSEAIKVNGEKYRQTGLLEHIPVFDRGFSFMYIHSGRNEEDSENFEMIRAAPRLTDELIQFRKDPDYDEDIVSAFDSDVYGFDGFDDKYDSLLPYDYETDIADVLNLDEQIAMYAANAWEFVSINDNTILFQKPKWEA